MLYSVKKSNLLNLLVLKSITTWFIFLALLELLDLVEPGCGPLRKFPSFHPARIHSFTAQNTYNKFFVVKLDRCTKTRTGVDSDSCFYSCDTFLFEHAMGVFPSI